MKSMESNIETLKKKIGAFCVVAACSQFIKQNRKYCSVKKHKKEDNVG